MMDECFDCFGVVDIIPMNVASRRAYIYIFIRTMTLFTMYLFKYETDVWHFLPAYL